MIPRIDLYEEDGEFVIEADLPGLSPTEVEVRVGRDRLLICGRHSRRSEAGAGATISLHRRERRSGRFERAIPLPHPVLRQAAQATLADGVLCVRLVIAKQDPAPERLPVRSPRRGQSRHLELAKG